MNGTRVAVAILALCAAAACKDEGGELREVTARRQAEAANRGPDRDTVPAAADTDTRLPAFVGDTPIAAAPAAPAPAAAADTVRKDSAVAPPTAAPAGFGTASRRGGRQDVHATLIGMRSASRPADGADRLVLDFGTDPVPAWSVGYVSRPVSHCGSGAPSNVPGNRWLYVHLRLTQAHDERGAPTIRQRQLSLGMPAMTALEMTCDFEGDVELVIGLAGQNPFRVTELSNPSRLVIDVRQQP